MGHKTPTESDKAIPSLFQGTIHIHLQLHNPKCQGMLWKNMSLGNFIIVQVSQSVCPTIRIPKVSLDGIILWKYCGITAHHWPIWPGVNDDYNYTIRLKYSKFTCSTPPRASDIKGYQMKNCICLIANETCGRIEICLLSLFWQPGNSL